MGLEDILKDIERLAPFKVGGLRCNNFDSGMGLDCLKKSRESLVAGFLAGYAFKNCDFPLSA